MHGKFPTKLHSCHGLCWPHVDDNVSLSASRSSFLVLHLLVQEIRRFLRDHQSPALTVHSIDNMNRLLYRSHTDRKPPLSQISRPSSFTELATSSLETNTSAAGNLSKYGSGFCKNHRKLFYNVWSLSKH